MRPLDGARPMYLTVGGEPVFGQLHEPAGAASGLGVLLLAPWGWEDVASYRSRGAWAVSLAAAGHRVLRFDFPGTGDSGGTAGDPGRIAAWVGSIDVAARWLLDDGGCSRVAAIGLGLSGLLASAAIEGGAPVADLVLWATPASGRAFARGERAFSRLQAPRYSLSGEPEPTGLPDGWLETGGFVLSAETLADVEGLRAVGGAAGALRRTLVLDRDGIPADPALLDGLRAAGVEVSEAPGGEWNAFVGHPERSVPPARAIAAVTAWLRAAGEGPAPRDAHPGPAETRVRVGDREILEHPETLTLGGDRLFAIRSEPAGGEAVRVCGVFLNAGAVRRIGPNRIWVEAARRWAAGGVPTVRIDLDAIGDADGDESRFGDVAAFYVPEFVTRVGAVLDDLQRRRVAERFVLVGLCSGGYWAFEAAAHDDRVRAAILLNPGVLVWDPLLQMRRDATKLGRLRQSVWRRRIARGELSVAVVAQVVRSTVNLLALAVAARFSPRAQDRSFATAVRRRLDHIGASGTRLVLAFSQDEPMAAELQRSGVAAAIGEWPQVSLVSLPGRDHTLRPAPTQRAAHRLLDAELDALLGRDES